MFIATSLKTKNYDSLKKMKLIRKKLGELYFLENISDSVNFTLRPSAWQAHSVTSLPSPKKETN